MNDENLRPCKPGHTNNPNGRPKGALGVKAQLKRLLKELDPEKLDHGSPIAQALIQKAFGKGIKPETQLKAMDMIMDRMDGKAQQHITQENINEKPTILKVERVRVKDETDRPTS